MALQNPDLFELLRQIRDADQRAEYHQQRALEWTRRAWFWREEMRWRIGEQRERDLP